MITHILKDGSVVSDLDGLTVSEQDAPTLYALLAHGGKHGKSKERNFNDGNKNRGAGSGRVGLLFG